METVKLQQQLDERISLFLKNNYADNAQLVLKFKKSQIKSKLYCNEFFQVPQNCVSKADSFDNKCLFTSPVPLYNNGNNCYINSSMQSLLPTITTELLTALRQARAARTPAIELFNTYIDQMERQSKGWNLAKNIENLKYFSKNFRKGAQEDAQEFLNGFLDRLREEFDMLAQFKGPRNPVRAAYAPSYDCRYFCTRCNNSNLKSPQPQEELTFFVEADRSLPGTLRAALLSLIDGYRCEHCRTESGSARMSGRFTAAPRAFICCVKRFRHGRHGDGGGGKVRREVGFEKKLWLPLAGERRLAACYELSSIVVHEGGSIHGGHYWCVTRVGDRWFRISDNSVSEVGEKFARASSVASSSYIYIYTRTDAGGKRGATGLGDGSTGKRVRLA